MPKNPRESWNVRGKRYSSRGERPESTASCPRYHTTRDRVTPTQCTPCPEKIHLVREKQLFSHSRSQRLQKVRKSFGSRIWHWKHANTNGQRRRGPSVRKNAAVSAEIRSCRYYAFSTQHSTDSESILFLEQESGCRRS